jgi:hypothetical protein
MLLMSSLNIVRQRLHNQRLAGLAFEKPEEVACWLGAVQAQEYPGAKWALAQRTTGISDENVDKAFAAGAILRTHALRPTWHFVAPEDIRWLQKLTAPGVHAVNAHLYRKMGLDDAIFARNHVVLTKALQGGQQRTRPELSSLLQEAGITRDGDAGLRLAYIPMHAELECLICSGSLRGKQHTYALLAERAPEA